MWPINIITHQVIMLSHNIVDVFYIICDKNIHENLYSILIVRTFLFSLSLCYIHKLWHLFSLICTIISYHWLSFMHNIRNRKNNKYISWTTIIDITDDNLWMTMQLIKQLLRRSNSPYGIPYCLTHLTIVWVLFALSYVYSLWNNIKNIYIYKKISLKLDYVL